MGKKKKKYDAAVDASNTGHSTKDKKQAVLSGTNKGSKKGTFIALAIAVAVIAVTGLLILGGSSASPFKVVTAEAGVVKIPVSEVNDGHAHFYTFNGKKSINFFVLKSSDGVIRAAFDACDVCFPEKKGYRQEGDLMVCNNCGQQFPSVKINEIRGGCNPAPLNRNVQEDYLVLNAADLEQGAFYF